MSNLDWADDALCKNMDAEVFFGKYEKMTTTEELRAKAICAECPVMAQCREYAVSTRQTSGVWGGTTPSGRMRLRSAWLREQGAKRQDRRNAEARRLAEMGCTPDQIAAQLGVHLRTAQRLSSSARISVSA